MDDTQWLPGDRGHLPTLACGIERAGRLTNLHSDPTKTVLVGTEMRDGWVHFLRDTVYLNSHPVRCATSQDYVRVLGRHALPHLFHAVDSRRLFSGARTACRALRASKLPAHYPLAMFVAKCHGTVNWFTNVRPPLLPGHASAIRYGRLGLARHRWLGPLGLCPLPPRSSRRGRWNSPGPGHLIRQLPQRLHPTLEPLQPHGSPVNAPRAPDCPLALPPLSALPHL